MTDTEYGRAVIQGVPVVVVPAEIDITTAHRLRAVLQDATSGEHPHVIVDMSGTRFCDTAGINVLLRASQRVAAANRELRLVIRAASPLTRALALAGLDGVLLCFTSLKQALDPSARYNNT